MSRRDENLAVLENYFEAMEQGGPPAAMAWYHPDVVLEVPGAHPASGVHTGRAGIGAFGATMADVTDRTFRLVPVDLLAGETHVVTIAEATATSAGRTLTWRRVIVSEVLDGLLHRLRFFESDQAAVDALLNGGDE